MFVPLIILSITQYSWRIAEGGGWKREWLTLIAAIIISVLPLSTPHPQSYLVFIYAVNAFGQSNTTGSTSIGIHYFYQIFAIFLVKLLLYHRKLTSIRNFKS